VSAGVAPQVPAAAVRAPALPGCFAILGLIALFIALGAIVALIQLPNGRTPTLAGRAAAGLVAAMSLFAAEALWWRRRWVFPATAAMFLSIFAAPVVLDGAEGWRDLTSDFPTLVVIGGFAMATLVYVYVEARRMFKASRAAAAPRGPGAGTP
jgi:hypothetical protein